MAEASATVRDIMHIERDPFGPPIAKSILLHIVLGGALAALIYLNVQFHGEEWGSKAPPGAIQATLVQSAASIPLPQNAPPTPNVLATQLPSPAPAPPSHASIPEQQPTAIPILARQPKLKPKERPHLASPKHAQPVKQQHRARYGEAQATQLPHAANNAPVANTNPVNVNNGNFAARFPWYVQMITRTVQQYWYTQDIAGSTPYGSQVSVTFVISRDGSVSDIAIATPSSSPTLNSSAVQAVQRVEAFQALPSEYTGRTVSVEYTFTYSTPSH